MHAGRTGISVRAVAAAALPLVRLLAARQRRRLRTDEVLDGFLIVLAERCNRPAPPAAEIPTARAASARS
jgi:hypothetical protein